MDRQLDMFLSLYADDFDMIYNPERNVSDIKKAQMIQAVEHKAFDDFFGKGTEADRKESCDGCPIISCSACTCG